MSTHYPHFSRGKASLSLVRLGLPILVTQWAQMGISTSNIIQAGHFSTTALAAVSLGASLWVPVMVLMNGIMMGLTPIIAPLYGGRRFDEMREPLQQMGWLALFAGALSVIIMTLGLPRLLHIMSVSPDVQHAATQYLWATAPGLPALALYFTLRCLSEGLNHTRPALYFSLLELGFSIVVGLLLVNGPWQLGAVGCGLAATTAMWVGFISMAIYVHRARIYKPIRLWQEGLQWPRPRAMFRLLKVGTPIGISIFSEVTMFSVIALLISVYGTVTIAAHELVLNLTAILFMVPMSLGIAMTIRVGTRLGEGSPYLARKEAWNGMLIAAVVAALNITLVGGLHRTLLSLYTDNGAVLALAVVLIRFALLFQLSDALQAGLGGALRGYKDTRAVMVITLIAYWPIGIGSGVLLGYGIPGLYHGLGIYGFWLGLVISLTSSAIMLLLRMLKVGRSLAPPSRTFKRMTPPVE